MLVKCHICGNENQMGSIFCRSCGEKLDMNKVAPENFKEKKKLNIMGWVRNALGVLLAIVVISVLAAILIPVGHTSYAEPSEEVKNAVKEKVDDIKGIISGETVVVRSNKFEFSAQELTTYVNSTIGDMPDTGAYAIQKVHIEEENNEITIYLYTKLAKAVSVVFTLSGEISMENGEAAFDVKSAKMGHNPMFGEFLKGQVSSKYLSLLSDDVKNVIKHASSIKVENSKLVIVLKGSHKAK